VHAGTAVSVSVGVYDDFDVIADLAPEEKV